MKEKIIALHGEHVLRRSALRLPGGEETLRRVLSGAGVRTVLEIGTYRGCTAAALAQWCRHVITVDLVNGQFIKENGTGFDRQKFWRSLGLPNVTLLLAENNDDKAKLLAPIHFDFAFIDGGHDEEEVRLDFELTRRCGRVLFHDYAAGGVAALVARLPESQVTLMGDFALWTA